MSLLFFNDNGKGIRGDLASVVKAVLTDTEALSEQSNQIGIDIGGKIIEPVLKFTQLLRAFDANAVGENIDGYEYLYRKLHSDNSQSPMSAETVFNFYSPNDGLPIFKNSGVVAPESVLINEHTVPLNISVFGKIIRFNHVGMPSSKYDKKVINAELTFKRYEKLIKKNPEEAVEWVNTLLMGGRMSESMANILLAYIEESKDAGKDYDDIMSGVVYLTTISPQYNVQW